MNAKLLVDNIEVTNRLSDKFGVKKEQLIQVVYEGVAGRNECTAHHPSSMAGVRCWGDATRALRDLLVPLGWRVDNTDNIASVIHPSGNLKIAVTNSSNGTGIEWGHPQPIREKGDGAQRAFYANQRVLTSILEQGANESQPIGSTFWYLCIYCGTEMVRAELLCPILDEQGAFKDFYERIALIGHDDEFRVPKSEPDSPQGDSGFEINVTRKQA
jgi:hypothetical protein